MPLDEEYDNPTPIESLLAIDKHMKAKLVGDIVNMLDYRMNEQASHSPNDNNNCSSFEIQNKQKVVPKFKEHSNTVSQ
jgi:hypothetical protein